MTVIVVVIAHRLSNYSKCRSNRSDASRRKRKQGTYEKLIQAGRYYTELVASQSDKVLERNIYL